MDDSQRFSYRDTATDFPPFLPFAARHDAALLRAAHAAWVGCREQWRQLLSQGPTLDEVPGQMTASEQAAALKTSWGTYWKTRAPHSPHSRREQASVLMGKHLQAAVQWAYASGQADAEALQPALRLLEGGEALKIAGGSVQTLGLALPGGGSLELPGALVIRSGADTRPLLYVPSHTAAVRVFDTLGALEAELRERLATLWPQATPAAQAPATFIYTHSEKPLRAGPNQMMRDFYRQARQTLRQDLADALEAGATRTYPATEALIQRLAAEPLLAEPPLLSPWQQAGDVDPALQLGGLQAGTALEARWSQVAQQREAIERYLLGSDDGAQRVARLETLRQHDQTLHSAREAADTAARQLLARDDLQGLLALRSGDDVLRAPLYLARKAGLQAELAIQALLLPMAAAEQRLLAKYLDEPAAATAEVLVSVLTLVPEQDVALIRPEELQGPLVIECLASDGRADCLWCYWPGRLGGLQRFTSREALHSALFGLAPNHSWMAVEYSAVEGDALEYSLQIQLYACEQAATAVLDQRADAATQASELQRLRAQALLDCGVPQQQARDLALAQVLEQQQGERLAAVLPSWLTRQPAQQREQLQALGREYQRASDVALTLLAQTLPARAAFAEQALQALLKQRFSGEGDYQVVLDLPETVTTRRQASGHPSPGGTAEEEVKVPSVARVKLPLVQLAMDNIDAPMQARLQFMQVEVRGGSKAGRELRKQAIDMAWLRRCVEELDLADAYEQRLRSAFVGAAGEPAFVTAYRREALLEPFRLVLKMQAQRFANHYAGNAVAARMVTVAIDAASAVQWQPAGQRVVLRAATFTTGGSDTAGRGTTLSGVTFIEETLSGLTVLVLPDCPDGQWLRRYPSLSEAREGLFELCLNAPFARYLVGRALEGDPTHHLSRLNTALVKKFSAMIGSGGGWPATTSLAAHLLDAHMGRLIQAHRDSSRSNDRLYLEQVALNNAMVLVYIKMAMGVLPFVGTAVALHDAWESANDAVDAFLNQRGGEGVQALREVLLSLMDAAMDLLPGGGAATPSPGTPRRLLRQRQLRRLGSGQTPLQARRGSAANAGAFEGYEYARDVRLSPVERGTHGLYRNIYRHADGHFILREARIYAVELGESPPTWRLSGSATKTYKQPIALDEAGNWQSHGTLYGTLVNGGLAGGGGVLGHLADGIDPYWPAAIRERLPRWWGDRLFRQQQRSLQHVQRATEQLDAQLVQTNELHRQTPPAAQALLSKPFARDAELAIAAFDGQQALLAFVHGEKRRTVIWNMSRTALVVVDRSLRRALIAKRAATLLLEDIEQLTDTLLDVVLDQPLFTERVCTLGLQRERLVLQLDAIEMAFARSKQWYPNVTAQEHRAKIGSHYNDFNEAFSSVAHACSRTINYVEVLHRYRPGMDLEGWLLFGVRAIAPSNRLLRALFAQRNLLEVRGSVAQRRRILEQCVEDYGQFRHQLRVWEAGDGEFIDSAYFDTTLAALQRNIDDARAWLAKIPEQVKKPAGGAASKRIFETVDDRLLVGIEVPATAQAPAQFTITGAGGVDEVYIQVEGGRWQLRAKPHAALPPLPVTLKQMKKRAQARLDHLPAYRAKVEGYARQGMTGKNLEGMLGEEAQELARLARDIAKEEAGAALIGRLEVAAADLQAAGRTLRLEATVGTRQPTEGDLDYLLERGEVEIRKVGALVELRKRPDGRPDFMQEYEIRRLQPDGVLWYAHFHYEQKAPRGFDAYIRAHLKTLEERYVGRQWQAEAGAVEPWRGAIGKRVAEAHFKAL